MTDNGKDNQYSQEITRQLTDVCDRILYGARSELYISMRYLELALSSLKISYTTELPGAGTDGYHLYVNPLYLADLYEQDRRQVNRLYLHVIVHGLLHHLTKRRREESALWDLSCDIACESIIDGLYVRPVRTGVSVLRREWYDLLRGGRKVLTAEGVYDSLMRRELPEGTLRRLSQEFSRDLHSLWPDPQNNPKSPPMEMVRQRWQDISDKTHARMRSQGAEAAEGDASLTEAVSLTNRPRCDYPTFLRRFATLHEQVGVDPDTFDYVFYSYGLSLYGNMPLIEPQEYAEVRLIDEFVIVLDVSMSVRGDLVHSFLGQTCSILRETQSFTRRVKLHILQCDDRVLRDDAITNLDEFNQYIKEMELVGGGGTDFRPAFTYVQEQQRKGQLTQLRGLLYFTDGRGTYPLRPPAWPAAFIFMEEDYTDVDVPPWAIRLVLGPSELEAPDSHD